MTNKEFNEFLKRKIDEIMGEHIFSKKDPELTRYNLVTIVNGEELRFKRYGKDPEKVKRELIVFIHEMYGVFTDKVIIEEDKTHPVQDK